MHWGKFSFVGSMLGGFVSLKFIQCLTWYFHQFGITFSYNHLKYFFSPILSLICLWELNNLYIRLACPKGLSNSYLYFLYLFMLQHGFFILTYFPVPLFSLALCLSCCYYQQLSYCIFLNLNFPLECLTFFPSTVLL